MIHQIPKILSPEACAEARCLLAAADWSDGRITAGYQSGLVKQNQQLAEDSPLAGQLRHIVLQALGKNPTFRAIALPHRVFPPLFNRYSEGMGFGDHIDNAIRSHAEGLVRTDLSATLFFNDPSEYDGGELVIEDAYGAHTVKLSAGDLILYPASSVHRVMPVTRGARIASFFWIQSLIRDDGQRALLHDLDVALGALRRRGLEGEAELIALTGVYHNLIRRWAET